MVETVPQPCQIFGTVLRPFSLGHHLLFVRLGLPFADNPDADCTVEQFLNAVAVCADDYEGTMESFLRNDWKENAGRWIAAVNRKKPDMKAALAIFRKHLEDGYRMAPVWRHVGKNQIHFTAPWEQQLKCRLVMAGFSLSEVLNGYMPSLWYDYFTVLELRLAETCESPADWKSIFYTMSDALTDEVPK